MKIHHIFSNVTGKIKYFKKYCKIEVWMGIRNVIEQVNTNAWVV